MVKTEPIITGKSNVFKAETISLPRPFQPKTNSTNTAPANIDANQPETAVITEEQIMDCLAIIKKTINEFEI